MIIKPVRFLEKAAQRSRVQALDPDRSPPDEYSVVSREVYVHCLDGFARTKLINGYFESRLQTVSTTRDWRTVLKLLEMTETHAPGK